jgi:HAD superfamily hydrolase (TIGR01509 family)
VGRAPRGSGGEDRAAKAGLPRTGGTALRPDGEALTGPDSPETRILPGGLSAVLFDWDGTLADSAEASFRCYVRLFSGYGITFDRALFGETYSPEWHRTYERLGLDRKCWSEADARWLALYEEEETRPLPGAIETVEQLAEAGLSLAVVTSGSRSRVERELERFGLARRFDAVVCAEDSVRRKPFPDPLELGLERLSIPAARAACVGDSPEDVEMARAAGVLSVAVPGAFPNREALRSARPDLWVDRLGVVAGALLALM